MMKISHRRFGVPWRLCAAGLLYIISPLLMPSVQAQGNVRLVGSVYDAETGEPLADVTVQVAASIFGGVTGEGGHFVIENIPPGNYTVIFSRLGYARERRTGVEIVEDAPRQLTVSLQPEAISLDSVVVFSGEKNEERSVDGEKIVLTPEDIERYDGLGLSQILQQVAGVQVESTGGGGSRTTIRIHGSRASQVLVLLDGQRLNNPQTGEVDLSEIPLDQIEQIEIVRQGNTAVFGGNAFGGIISFKTQQLKDRNYAALRSRAGSFSTAEGSASAGLAFHHLIVLANYQQDYSRRNYEYSYENTTLQRENAWYRNQKVFGKLSVSLPRHHFSARFHVRQGEQGLPSAFFEEMNHYSAFKESVSRALQIDHRWFVSSQGYLEGNLAYHHLEQDFFNEMDPSPFTRYKVEQTNEVYEGELKGFFSISSFLDGRVGYRYQEERLIHRDVLFSNRSIGKKERPTRAGYGSIDVSLPAFSPLFRVLKFRSAIRYEKYFDQPGEWHPLIGLSAVPHYIPWLSISASRAKAIRYPDFNSLFWKGDSRARGNPDLLPERKTLWNVTARITPQNSCLPLFSAYYYAENITDLIYWHRTFNGTWEPRNEERVEKQGVDLQLEEQLIREHIRVQAAYSFIEAINKSAEPNRKDKRIVFIPRHTVNTSLWLGLGSVQSLLVYRHVSEREIVPANTGNRLPAYEIWDLSISFQRTIDKFMLDFGVAVKNLTGTDYQLLRGYPMPGREYQLTLEVKYATQ